MNIHHRAIKATLAGLLLATTFGASSALANVRNRGCVSACRQMRHACVLECTAEANCGMHYKLFRAQCVADTLPGDDRQVCFHDAGSDRFGCQTNVKSCKAECVQEFDSCRDTCGVR